MNAEAVEKKFFTLLRNVVKEKIPVQNLTEYMQEVEEFCEDDGMELSEFLEEVFPDVICEEVNEIINDAAWRSDSVGKKCVTNPEILSELYPILTKIDENTELVFATNPYTPLEILNALCESNYSWEEDSTASCLARNTSNESLLKILSTKSDPSTRYSVAANIKTPIEILKSLAADEQFSQHMLYLTFDGGMSPNASDPILEMTKSSIKFAVIHNVHTPLEVIYQIANNDENFNLKTNLDFSETEKTNVNLCIKGEAEKILISRR